MGLPLVYGRGGGADGAAARRGASPRPWVWVLVVGGASAASMAVLARPAPSALDKQGGAGPSTSGPAQASGAGGEGCSEEWEQSWLLLPSVSQAASSARFGVYTPKIAPFVDACCAALTGSKVSLHCHFELPTAKRRSAPSRLTLSRASQISV